MAYTYGAVVSEQFTLDDFLFTYNITGTVTTDDVGKAVTIDTTAASAMKLTGDNDLIMGRLETYEDRSLTLGVKVGTVARKFKSRLPAALSHGIVVGNAVSGSAVAGQVKVATSQTEPKPNRVVEVATDYVVVEYL